MTLQSYFRLAAQLGDPDAQQELAFCLANGKGCKKDRKESAKWYRAAVGPLNTLIPWFKILIFSSGCPRGQRHWPRVDL